MAAFIYFQAVLAWALSILGFTLALTGIAPGAITMGMGCLIAAPFVTAFAVAVWHIESGR